MNRVRARSRTQRRDAEPTIEGMNPNLARTPTTGTTDAALSAARAVLKDLFGPPSWRSFAVRFWDGTVEGPGEEHEPHFMLTLRRPGALRRMLLPPTDLALGEAYLRDDFDVEGDLEKAAGLAELIVARLRSPTLLARYALTLRRWVQRLEARHEEAARLAGEQAYRVWRLYMAASARSFATGRIGIVQALFCRTNDTGLCDLPLTREDLYRPAASEGR